MSPHWPHSEPERPQETTQTCIRGCSSRRNADDGTVLRIGRRADTPGLLCSPCADRIWQKLSDLVELYALLPYVMDPGSVTSDGSKHTKADAPPVPFRPGVTDMTDGRMAHTLAYADQPLSWNRRGALGVLNGWGRLVREEMSLAAEPEPTVSGESAMLRRHIDWIVRQPWVDEMHDEIVALHSELATLCGEAKPHPIGQCPAVTEGGTCTAPLYAPVFGDTIECRRCGTSWTRPVWEHLGQMIVQDQTAQPEEVAG